MYTLCWALMPSLLANQGGHPSFPFACSVACCLYALYCLFALIPSVVDSYFSLLARCLGVKSLRILQSFPLHLLYNASYTPPCLLMYASVVVDSYATLCYLALGYLQIAGSSSFPFTYSVWPAASYALYCLLMYTLLCWRYGSYALSVSA
jgi:hypothetical protein